MPRIPGNLQNGAYGTDNPNLSLTQRQPVRPVTTVRSPTQAQEQFSTSGLDDNVARALQQSQDNTRAATSQSKGSPDGDSNLLQGVTLVNGGANGATPNVLRHGLGRKAQGYQILGTTGGTVTQSALIPNPDPNEDKGIVRIWTLRTLFAGSTAVVANIKVF